MTTEQTNVTTSDENTVRKTVTVQASPAIAWQVFTAQMGTWWPLMSHKIGKTTAVDAVIEPRVGGRWYERGDDGSSCDWGRVLAWDPPRLLVLTWDINADWAYDATLQTEVEVRFSADGSGGTRVDLEHRRLDRLGERRHEVRAVFDSENGWGGLLASFARAAAAAAPASA